MGVTNVETDEVDGDRGGGSSWDRSSDLLKFLRSLLCIATTVAAVLMLSSLCDCSSLSNCFNVGFNFTSLVSWSML